MSLWDSIMSLFGGKKKPAAQQFPMGGARRTGGYGMGSRQTNNLPTSAPAMPMRKNRQVYETRRVDQPEWAQGLSKTDLIAEIGKHIQCRFVPKFEMKRIMSTNIGPDGNLIPEFDGIAASCGAIQQTGLKVARQQGLSQAYRYVDEYMAYRACCETPAKCPFYQAAVGDMDAVNKQRR